MSDEELIYLFVVDQNDWAFNCLYLKYQNIISFSIRKNFSKFFSLPLELNDLESIAYFIFFQAVINFQFNKNKSFKNFLLLNLEWGLLKYLKKYLTKNHQILNMAYYYQDYFLDNNLIDQSSFYQINLFDLNNLKLSLSEKNVLKLKYQGFSNQEIMAKLNLTYKQVDNAFQRVNLKLKKY